MTKYKTPRTILIKRAASNNRFLFRILCYNIMMKKSSDFDAVLDARSTACAKEFDEHVYSACTAHAASRMLTSFVATFPLSCCARACALAEASCCSLSLLSHTISPHNLPLGLQLISLPLVDNSCCLCSSVKRCHFDLRVTL